MPKEHLSRSDRAQIRQSGGIAPVHPAATVTPTATTLVTVAPTAPPPPNPIIPTANQDKQQQAYAQALMPYLAPTEQNTLSATYGSTTGGGRNAGSANTPALNRNFFLGQNRAKDALLALEAARSAAGGSATDAGFSFLNQSINLLKKYGGADLENGMSRENYTKFSDEFKALLEQAKADRIPAFYQNAAQMFLQPTTAEPLMATDKYGFGAASRRLFT